MIGMIWAEAADRIIGKDGGMPWHLPEDLAHFREVTAGRPVIMGRRTWESLPEAHRPLRGRTNIVVSSSGAGSSGGALAAPSLEQALDLAAAADGSDEIWIIGGRSLYLAAMDLADAIEITTVDLEIGGDTRAPRPRGFTPTSGTSWRRSSAGIDYLFTRWTRTQA